MRVLILGGAGFVGLNVAEALATNGHDAIVFDRRPPPDGFSAHTDAIIGDVTDLGALREAAHGVDAIVHGAAVTADAARDADDPETILAVNMAAMAPVLRTAKEAGVGRTVVLSSAAAFGTASFSRSPIREDVMCDPVSLYSITKYASERVARRLANLWQLDMRIARLSGVFGKWEHPTGARDTLSPHHQVARAFDRGEPALFERPGFRDWTYAPDVGEAVSRLVAHAAPRYDLYHISAGRHWSALSWAEALAAHTPGATVRLAQPGEAATIDLYEPQDRAPMEVRRMLADIGPATRSSPRCAAEFAHWWTAHGRPLAGAAEAAG